MEEEIKKIREELNELKLREEERKTQEKEKLRQQRLEEEAENNRQFFLKHGCTIEEYLKEEEFRQIEAMCEDAQWHRDYDDLCNSW